jgi:CxxC-x17-CxxC domain-containing protein
MEVQFEDRILICSDCHGEFIFTAGEQLFFHDKQFKNDPKRCKPCKSRRSGLSAGAHGGGPAAAGLSRTETRTECSECGVQTTVPFKPTQGRPVLCRQCFQVKAKAAVATSSLGKVEGAVAAPPEQPASEPSPVSTEQDDAKLATNGAVSASVSMAVASQIPAELLAAASSEMGSSGQIASRAEASEA